MAAGGNGNGSSADGPGYDWALVHESLMRSVPFGVMLFDRDLVIRDISRAGAKALGTSRKGLRGGHLADHLPKEHLADCRRILRGESIRTEVQIAAALSPAESLLEVWGLPLRGERGLIVGGALTAVDVTEQRRAADLAERLSFVDPLTELPNRPAISMMLRRMLAGTSAEQRHPALVWLNLDRFKDVGDAYGEGAGDLLLGAVAERLHDGVRASDVVGRVGGDDFLIVLPRVASRRSLQRLLGRIHALFDEPFFAESESVLLDATSGAAVYPEAGGDAHELEEHAHAAMRAAKQFGGGASQIYESPATKDASRRLRLVREIREGIERRQFRLHYQPKTSLASGEVQALEALARWQHPERGLLSPGEFIDLAEETGAIVPLGRHLLRLACEEYARWRRELEPPPRLAVNISAREFQRGDINAQVQAAAKAAGIPVSALEIEITETAVLAAPARVAKALGSLRAAGATIALDDFGTGFSSLTHLRELPIDRVKVDRSFVASCLGDRSAAAILVGVTHIAHDLGLEATAEGVESEAQLEFVRAVGCDAAQGFYLARPMPPEECIRFLRRAAERPAS